MIKRFDDFLDNISKWGVVFCVIFMLLLTISNIVLRWFQLSALWVEPLVRHLVFVAAFLGGSLATGNQHHIKIDLVSKLLEKLKKEKLRRLLDLFLSIGTLFATFFLIKAGTDLAIIEFEYGKPAFLGIHSGYLLSIIPCGIGLISLRLFLRFLLQLGFGREKVV